MLSLGNIASRRSLGTLPCTSGFSCLVSLPAAAATAELWYQNSGCSGLNSCWFSKEVLEWAMRREFSFVHQLVCIFLCRCLLTCSRVENCLLCKESASHKLRVSPRYADGTLTCRHVRTRGQYVSLDGFLWWFRSSGKHNYKGSGLISAQGSKRVVG